MLNQHLDCLENLTELELLAKKMRSGTAGIEYGRPPHLLDVSKIVMKAWTDLSHETIRNCWIKADCLPLGMMDELESLSSVRMIDDEAEKKSLEEICERLTSLNVLSNEEPVEQVIEHWIDLEKNEEFMADFINLEIEEPTSASELLEVDLRPEVIVCDDEEAEKEMDTDLPDISEEYQASIHNELIKSIEVLKSFWASSKIQLPHDKRLNFVTDLRKMTVELSSWKSRNSKVQLTLQDMWNRTSV